ncbi:MAG: hypothetical protein ACLPWS_06335 [Rhodomicrobium sp.]
MAGVKYDDLANAVEFASISGFDNSAYVCTVTGATYYVSSEIDEEVPEDLETSDKYIQVPTKRDLDLGTRLALWFVEEELPDDYDTAAGFFRKKGAYGRFKDLLHRRGALEKWYEYEARATEAALRLWCEENGVELSFAKSEPSAVPQKD